jgi:hypothetical protein
LFSGVAAADGGPLLKGEAKKMGMEDFPYPVTQLTQLHSAVQQALADDLNGSAAPVSLLVIPPFRHIGRQPGGTARGSWLRGSTRAASPEWTLALTGDRLIAVARQRATSQIEVTAIPFESMMAFEWGAILLYSWIEIVWADPDLRHTRIEYNTVGEPLLRELLATLQRVVLARRPQPFDARVPVSIEPLYGASMKFYNMLRLHALLADEQVYAYSFEPTIRPRWFWGHGREGLLWAVTNDHGLLIREPRESYPYGVVYTFCPRTEIRGARVVATEQEVELRLTMGQSGWEVKGVFSLARQAELTASLELISGQPVTASLAG